MNHKCDGDTLAKLLTPSIVKIRPFSTSKTAAVNPHVLATEFQRNFKRSDEADGLFPYTETDDKVPQFICSCCQSNGENVSNLCDGLVLSSNIARITAEIPVGISMPRRHPYPRKPNCAEAVKAVRDHCPFLPEVALWSDFCGFLSTDTKWWFSSPIGQVELYAPWVILLKQYTVSSETYDQANTTTDDALEHHRGRWILFGKYLIGNITTNEGEPHWSIDEDSTVASKIIRSCYNDLRGKSTCWSPLSRLSLVPYSDGDTHADTTEGKPKTKKARYLVRRTDDYITPKWIERKLIYILNAVLHTLEKFRNDPKYLANDEWFYSDITQKSFGQMLEDNLVEATLDGFELRGEGCRFFDVLSSEEKDTAKNMLRNIAKRFAFMYRVQVRSYRLWSPRTE